MPIGNLTPRDQLKAQYERLRLLRMNVKELLRHIHEVVNEMHANPNWVALSSAQERAYTTNILGVADQANANIPDDPDGD